MKTFVYKAKKGPDELVEGTITAQSKHDAVEQLVRQGLVATFVQDKEELAASTSDKKLRRYFGVRLKTLIVFTRQLAKLLSSGIPILRALAILSEQTQGSYFKGIINEVAERVKNGQTFSSSLKEFPVIFSPFYIAMVKAGEDSGNIDKSLTRLADYYSQQAELFTKIKAALAYPLLILIVGIGTLIFIFTSVIPRIIPILLNLNIKMPLATKILIGMSAFLREGWPWILLFAGILFLIFMRALKKPVFQRYFSHFKRSLPIFGDLFFKSNFSKFSRALETSLRSGIALVTAMKLTLPIVTDVVMREQLSLSLGELERGGSFGGSLKRGKIFPPFVYNLIIMGEESGRLNDALSDIADSFEKDCEEIIKVLTTLLEPLMVLIIGLIVGFIVSAVLMPIFQLNFISL